MNSTYTVIVNFNAPASDQNQALTEIGAYIGSFLSKQPGFVRSQLCQSVDGTQIVHVAEWQSEVAFKKFAAIARDHPDLPGLLKYKPSAAFFTVWNQY
jgi:heme-degrading monooxygenase HmoA